jgi:MFS family permease
VGNIGEHPHEDHHHHIPFARHDDPDVEVSERSILAAAIIGSSMAFIDGTVANVALPSIPTDLGATLAEAQWVVQAYALLLATLILVGGSLGDRFGHRRVFVLGISIFTLGSLGCAFAASIDQLVAARATGEPSRWSAVWLDLLCVWRVSILGTREKRWPTENRPRPLQSS